MVNATFEWRPEGAVEEYLTKVIAQLLENMYLKYKREKAVAIANEDPGCVPGISPNEESENPIRTHPENLFSEFSALRSETENRRHVSTWMFALQENSSLGDGEYRRVTAQFTARREGAI